MEAVLLIGIPGSGKSSFYRERFFDTHVRISLDMVKTRERERVLAAACLLAGQSFVVDDTNVLRSQRAAFVEPARAAGFRVAGYEMTCDLKRAWMRNRGRGRRAVPPAGIAAAAKRLQRPTWSEGFDALFSVDADGGGFVVRERARHSERDAAPGAAAGPPRGGIGNRRAVLSRMSKGEEKT